MTKVDKRVFVKYANRKIHELGHRSSYISMEDLLELVASGADIQVVEDVTGHDITAYTFARLVYDRCRMDKNAYKAEELQRIIVSNPPPIRTIVSNPPPKLALRKKAEAA